MNSATELTQQSLRRALGSFATGVTVVTTTDPAGRPIGITANSFTSVSLSPPLILICISHRAKSIAIFREAGFFAINVLHADQQALAKSFGAPSEEKWTGIDPLFRNSRAPLLPDAAAYFECDTRSIVTAGDHDVLIGHVQSFSSDPVRLPLIFHAGRFAALHESAHHHVKA